MLRCKRTRWAQPRTDARAHKDRSLAIPFPHDSDDNARKGLHARARRVHEHGRDRGAKSAREEHEMRGSVAGDIGKGLRDPFLRLKQRALLQL
jgi:hypothetical protein